MWSIMAEIEDLNAIITAATSKPPIAIPTTSNPIGSVEENIGAADAPTCEMVLDASVKSMISPGFIRVFLRINTSSKLCPLLGGLTPRYFLYRPSRKAGENRLTRARTKLEGHRRLSASASSAFATTSQSHCCADGAPNCLDDFS